VKTQLLACDLRHKRPTQTQRVSSTGRACLSMAAFVGTAEPSADCRPKMTMQAGVATPLASWENEGGQHALTAQGDDHLDWAGFLARFYPDARNHDYTSLAAYVEYRKRLAPAVEAPGVNRPPERSRP